MLLRMASDSRSGSRAGDPLDDRERSVVIDGDANAPIAQGWCSQRVRIEALGLPVRFLESPTRLLPQGTISQ